MRLQKNNLNVLRLIGARYSKGYDNQRHMLFLGLSQIAQAEIVLRCFVKTFFFFSRISSFIKIAINKNKKLYTYSISIAVSALQFSCQFNLANYQL